MTTCCSLGVMSNRLASIAERLATNASNVYAFESWHPLSILQLQACRSDGRTNPKTWLSTKNVKGDGEAVKANDKKPEQIPPQPQNGKKRKVPVLPPANPNESRAESRDGAQPKEAKTKREQKITLCFLKKKKFPCCVKADPEPSLDSMCASCNNNCCRVCDILCKYVHDAIRCIYCIVNCTCPKTNFCLMLRQLVAATCAVCTDCIYIVRHILKCIVGISEQ